MPQSTFDDKYRFLRAQERLSFEEIVRLARLAARLGVRKVRLTGGEPLLRSGLPDLVAELSGIEGIDDLALTTNGVLLAQHAAELKGNGLHRVTVSLDSLDEAVFTQMSGGFGGLPQVLDGIEAALDAGLAARQGQHRGAARASTTTRCSTCSSVSAARASPCG